VDANGRSPFGRWFSLVILVGGSTKARQSAAIADAQAGWWDYWRHKRDGE